MQPRPSLLRASQQVSSPNPMKSTQPPNNYNRRLRFLRAHGCTQRHGTPQPAQLSSSINTRITCARSSRVTRTHAGRAFSLHGSPKLSPGTVAQQSTPHFRIKSHPLHRCLPAILSLRSRVRWCESASWRVTLDV